MSWIRMFRRRWTPWDAIAFFDARARSRVRWWRQFWAQVEWKTWTKVEGIYRERNS